MKAGSPMALVIPFKRDSWKIKVKEHVDEPLNQISIFPRIFENYKNKFWRKKEFK